MNLYLISILTAAIVCGTPLVLAGIVIGLRNSMAIRREMK